MTITGYIENGAIVLDRPVELPDGAVVKIELTQRGSCADCREPHASFAERYSAFIGVLEGLPEDWSENHDRYLRDEHGV